ncbi:hypothetical protein PsorP6_011335 [Peronosclerospora sorghi]|uniref:Uncharacterized protein n=1 Tax=Peronosclerospora sorghi TaxID=230839 RepID=A0ACC0WLH8_9STRA|nr:hypothetical protein PsorP6_011335 [Peronosclerospora sorghi]
MQIDIETIGFTPGIQMRYALYDTATSGSQLERPTREHLRSLFGLENTSSNQFLNLRHDTRILQVTLRPSWVRLEIVEHVLHHGVT